MFLKRKVDFKVFDRTEILNLLEKIVQETIQYANMRKFFENEIHFSDNTIF